VSASIEGGVLGLVREMAPVVLFFFIAFLLIFVMFKLFVSQYEIEFSAFGPQNRGAHQEVRVPQWIAAFGFEQAQRVLPA
jgi:hypothetical protein